MAKTTAGDLIHGGMRGAEGLYSGLLGGGPANPEYNTVPMAAPYMSEAFDVGKGMEDVLGGAGKTMLSEAMPGTPEESNLWNLTARRYENQIAPQFAGAGLLTSGPGMQGMSQGLQDLSTQFTQMRMKALQDAFSNYMGGAGNISKLFAGLGGEMLGAPVYQPGSEKGLWGRILGPLGGGSGASSLIGSQGTSTSAGSGISGLFG